MNNISSKFATSIPIIAYTDDTLDGLYGTDMLQRIENTTKAIAQKIIISNEANIEEADWQSVQCIESSAFYYQPKDNLADLFLIKNPIAHKCVDNPDDYNYYADGKTLGLICSLMAINKIDMDILEKRMEYHEVKTGFWRSLFSKEKPQSEICFENITKIRSDLRSTISNKMKEIMKSENIDQKEKQQYLDANNSIMLLADNLP